MSFQVLVVISFKRTKFRQIFCRKEVGAWFGYGKISGYFKGFYSRDVQGEEVGREREGNFRVCILCFIIFFRGGNSYFYFIDGGFEIKIGLDICQGYIQLRGIESKICSCFIVCFFRGLFRFFLSRLVLCWEYQQVEVQDFIGNQEVGFWGIFGIYEDQGIRFEINRILVLQVSVRLGMGILKVQITGRKLNC